jgi:hypothetical protein
MTRQGCSTKGRESYSQLLIRQPLRSDFLLRVSDIPEGCPLRRSAGSGGSTKGRESYNQIPFRQPPAQQLSMPCKINGRWPVRLAIQPVQAVQRRAAHPTCSLGFVKPGLRFP